jgi:hypothetical protein
MLGSKVRKLLSNAERPIGTHKLCNLEMFVVSQKSEGIMDSADIEF